MNKHKFWIAILLIMSFGLAAAACSSQPLSSSGNPAAPAAPAQASAPESKPATGGEGGEGGNASEGPRTNSLTYPDNLPAAPVSESENGGNGADSQIGEELMVKYEDPQGNYSVLFVDSWTQEPGDQPDSIRSVSGDWIVQVAVIPSDGKTAQQMAEALDTSLSGSITGYEKIALQSGEVNSTPAASLTYQYESGTNPVTGKGLPFIATQVLVEDQTGDKLAQLTFSAPSSVYGDVSEIFDKILAGYVWK